LKSKLTSVDRINSRSSKVLPLGEDLGGVKNYTVSAI
jgi:hypothetical protein